VRVLRRIASGVFAGGVLFGLLWTGVRFEVTWIIGFAMAAVAILAAIEYVRLLSRLGINLSRAAFLPWVPILVAATIAFSGRYLNVVLIFAVACQLLRHLVDDPQRDGLLRAGAAALGVLYIPWLLHFIYPLYAYTSPGRPLVGLSAASAVLLAVWGFDTGAFFVGSLVGRRRAFPSISPNKTWEGILGGMVFAVVGAMVGVSISPAWRELVFWGGFPPLAITAVLVGGAAQLGDLFESKLKRAACVKDSGVFLPGHGGALDRIDGLLFALPVFFCYFDVVVRPLLDALP